ncbi:acyl-CoA dehydrogenase C-terminal domain-containing protein [Pseudomaricurvus sp. HS19]|uniref:acyl-CoA dehydrogenase C-terminal domain-containing protein n=1 Tax=Pseudomaricurvus sp. HS19 TaxID=2692626 RepID=UPI001370E642|nr:acyl-CoA dehydrogenase C-terminal domain-containing protein [Pseudomaricurvus sp. HS19]MYM62111.1 acyl-CoA dehydrogenase [Pseudomaricurvus sp. HS19]
MTDYKAPLRDTQFTLFELLDYEQHWQSLPSYGDTGADIANAILEESAKFCENVLGPINQSGDAEGCSWQDGEVTTPKGFKEAYHQYVEAGWPSISHDVEYGGQGLPPSLGMAVNEMSGTANWSWAMYPGLSHGAMNTIDAHGTEEQKQTYLTKLISGHWTGTMCLTEPHCGTDLGILRTKATPNADGSYAISGTKIFISAGEHDMADNIIHIVLARLPDAPPGTKGISLFIVPKFNVNPDGTPGERNAVSCGSIEHKMGIKASATCVMNFDGAKGYLIGPPNRGLNCMFTFMNTARLGTAMQGVAHAELGFQKSLAYTRERLQMRSLSGAKNPDGPADPIIVHPDVRRMLLTQKAIAEGGRMLLAYCGKLVDIVADGDEAASKEADGKLSYLTPIAKAFLTEAGFESANLGMQCFGGHGYIAEWGVEQNVRDARIAMIYEGTTGVQALDLLGRKVLMSQGEIMKPFTKEVHKFCKANEGSPHVEALAKVNQQLGELTMHVGMLALENPDEVGAASVDYLMYSGYFVMGYLWAMAALKAQQALDEGRGDSAFYTAKIRTANFYFARILPRTAGLAETIKAGAASLMEMDDDAFAF